MTGLTLTVDARLELAGVEESVTVSAESPMLQARESKVGGVVENIQIENIPINARNVQELALLVPGVKPSKHFWDTKVRVPATGFGTAGRGQGIHFSLDGGDNTDDAVGGIVQQVSMDSIQEFEVVTAGMKAEYGRADGGVIQMVSKSGTNQFRGSFFEFFRDRSLNAKTQPEKEAGIEKGPFRRHQFGATLGGPIVGDQAFFFVAYERLQEDVSTVLGVPAEVEALYDPAFIADHGGFGVVDQPYRRNYLTAKYTQQFNPRNRLDVRFALEKNASEGEVDSTKVTRDQTRTQTNDLWSLLGRFQTIVGGAALNELVVQVSDFANDQIHDVEPDFASPRLTFPSLTAGQDSLAPEITSQRKYQFRNDFSYSLKTHDLKFGGSVLRIDPVSTDAPFFTQGVFNYANDGDPLDSALLFRQAAPIDPFQNSSAVYSVYLQDDWRVSESLTLNLGVRYDAEIGGLSNVEYGASGSVLIEDPRSPFFGQGTLQDDKDNVAPRLGFAWDVGSSGKTVVRGGWGLFYAKIHLITTTFTFVDAQDPQFVFLFNPPFGPNNIPPFDTLGAFLIAQNFILAPGFELPRSAQATLGLSRQLTPTLALDVDYVHSVLRLNKGSDLNEPTIPFDDTSRLFWPEVRGRLVITESIGRNEYDGLQVSARKRFANRTQFVANYTLSRLTGTSFTIAECRDCIGDDRDVGPLRSDTTHRVVLSGIFQLPGGFQVSALFQGESAHPLNAETVQDLNGNGQTGDFVVGPNGEPPGRGNFRGDPTYILDLRVAKFFRFGETKNLQLMFEVLNLFNHVNWGRNFEDVTESPNFGMPTGELWTNQRQVQLGVRFSF